MKEQKVVYLSMTGAAKRLGCGEATVRRAAKKARIGIITESDRVVALAEADLPLLRPLIHETSGNPVWIAAGREKRRRPKRR